MTITHAQYAEMLARTARNAIRKPHTVQTDSETGEGDCDSAGNKPLARPTCLSRRIRQDTKPLLNNLEVEFFEYLKAFLPQHVSLIRPQALRFRLANGLWYKPDFTAKIECLLFAWEVKGPHAWRGGFENIKMAAATYPEWNWRLMWKENGLWQEQKVLP